MDKRLHQWTRSNSSKRSSSTTLVELRDLINTSATDSDNDGQKDINASIIFDGTNYMLMLKSQSGANYEMQISDNHASRIMLMMQQTEHN